MKDDVVNTQELLSALVDGELTGPELEQALALAEDAQGQANWQLYHLVGDVLRSPDLAHHSQHDLLSGLRAQLAQEPPLQALSESVAETEMAAESVSAPRVAVAPGGLEQVQAPALASAQQRDPAAIAAGISACEALFAMLDDELAKMPWLSGEQFGLGDIAVAPFVYNLLSILDSWQPRPHLQRWYQQISQRPAWREVVQIPVT